VEPQGTAVLEKGTRLGKYEIERLVGIGSMAAVYEAVDSRTGKHVAIKVLSAGLAAMPPARARFLKEAKLTARVRHPHIVEVTDVDEDTAQAYFVMQLLEGEDLGQRLQRSGPLSTRETAELMVPVCDAVAEAHKHGITHRDLKPANIFLTTRDGRLHPVVLDFGIAMDERATKTLEGVGSADARRPVFGTPYYLAPEQIEDHRAAGPKSDQYALGVILYECLTGEPPHRGDTVEELFRAIAGSDQNSPRARRPDVPEELDAVVRRALSRNPEARYTWVAALARALRPFVSNRAMFPTPASPLTALEATKPAARRPTPSSPAITLEAMKPSPFVRTLTPEVEELDRAWFAAGEELHRAPVETVSPFPIDIDPTPDAEPPPSGEVAAEIDATKSRGWRPTSRRVWIGAAAGASLAILLVALVVTRGSPSAAPPPQATLVPAVVPSSPVPSAPPAPAPAEPPAMAKTEPPAPVAAEPAVAKSEPPAPAEPAAVERGPDPHPNPLPKTGEGIRSGDPLPKTGEGTGSEAPAEPAIAKSEPARARKPAADRPRAQKAAGVRMHKGVPLLD
jgi:serine/threonine-protein kinase